MEKGYLNKNIVFIGEFKPSKFDKLYFIKNELLSEDDFLEGSIFLPDISIIETKNYNIEVNQNRFTINFKTIEFELNFEKLTHILRDSIIRVFGFNFKRVLFLEDATETKKFFYIENNNINKFFDSDDTAYGYYVSRSIDESRLKLDIKPVMLHKVDENLLVNALDFSFNFHFENIDFRNKLSMYSYFENLSLEIINSYE